MKGVDLTRGQNGLLKFQGAFFGTTTRSSYRLLASRLISHGSLPRYPVVMEALMVDRATNNGPRCAVVSCGMERCFLSQKDSGVGRGVTGKYLNGTNFKTVKGGVIPPITVVATSDVNAPDKSFYANVTCKPSEMKVNFCTLFTPGGNGIDVVIHVESIRAISERFVNTACGFFLGKRVAYPVVANYGVYKEDGIRSLYRGDAQDIGISIELLPLSMPDEDFNVLFFYADLIGLEGDELAQFMPLARERYAKFKLSSSIIVIVE
uniref:ATP-dependent DNA helicase 2 subunit KU70 isoform X2 n=1 Tax=Tanacetum cinerariifolium TaxID=118510 RepID=A0A6L2JRH7_TANCI|nr:ATP-dependent DNA helicase 2 subunit KU70 isoform X2 [Tanacetum cinerariifolium]